MIRYHPEVLSDPVDLPAGIDRVEVVLPSGDVLTVSVVDGGVDVRNNGRRASSGVVVAPRAHNAVEIRVAP